MSHRGEHITAPKHQQNKKPIAITNDRLIEIQQLVDDQNFRNRTPAEQSAFEDLLDEVDHLRDNFAEAVAEQTKELRLRIHNLERHNQYFERCESRWCNPAAPLAVAAEAEHTVPQQGDWYATMSAQVEETVAAKQLIIEDLEATREWAAIRLERIASDSRMTDPDIAAELRGFAMWLRSGNYSAKQLVAERTKELQEKLAETDLCRVAAESEVDKLECQLTEARRDGERAKETIANYLCRRVTVYDGNTEINEVYRELRFLGETFGDCGGREEIIKNWQAKRVAKFRKKLRKAIDAAIAQAGQEQHG